MNDPVFIISTLMAQCARLMRALRATLNSRTDSERMELVEFAEDDYLQTLGKLFPEEEENDIALS